MYLHNTPVFITAIYFHQMHSHQEAGYDKLPDILSKVDTEFIVDISEYS